MFESLVNTEGITLKTSIKYQKEYDRDTEQEILALLEKSSNAKDFSWESKIKEVEEIQKDRVYINDVKLRPFCYIISETGVSAYHKSVCKADTSSAGQSMFFYPQCSCNGKRFRSLSGRDSFPYRFHRSRRMAFRW